MNWNLSCPDWKERLRARRSLVPDLPLDEAEAARAVAIFNKLRLADVPGTPTMEEAGGDWFRDIVRAMFGCVDRITMIRAIVELLLLVPKKNNKTTGGALLMLTALVMNRRPRAPFALMAPVQDTADEAFAAAEGAIGLDPVLERLFHVRSHLKTIVHRETKADLQIMTFDPDVLTGKKFVGTLIDELHVIAKNAKAAKALRQVRGGMVPFPEAFLAFITTMPDDIPTGVMKAELTKARNIRDGKAEGKMLPVLYEFPREMQQDKAVWTDPANWPMVNPNLGRSVTVEKLLELYEDAAPKGEEEVRGWASQHLNIEIGLGLMSDRWAGADFWEAAGDSTLTLDALLARCEVVVIGIDGGGLDDLLGLTVAGRERGTRRWLCWHHAWAHQIVLERRKEIASRLQDYAREGDLTLVEQPGQDVEQLADIVCRVRDADLLPEKNAIGVDPAGIGDIVDALTAPERGIEQQQIIGVSQGWRMTGAVKTCERKLAGGELVHGARPLMAWCVGNAKVEDKGNAVVITKQVSGKAKIDPLMSTFNAVSLLALNPESTLNIHDGDLLVA
jgi:phage terminase large subunit-like protein